MNSKIEVKVNYTAEDFARGAKYIQSRKTFAKYMYLLPFIIITLILSVLFLSDPAKFVTAFSRPQSFLPILIPVIVLLPVFYFLSRKKTSFFVRKQFERQIKSSPVLQETKTLIFDEEGIKGQQNLGTGETNWSAFLEATETEDDFYFFTAKNFAQFIHQKAFKDENQKDQLRELAKRKLGDKAKFN
jgi:uncharacterized protein YneF (UPF0154 family)